MKRKAFTPEKTCLLATKFERACALSEADGMVWFSAALARQVLNELHEHARLRRVAAEVLAAGGSEQ